MTGCIFHTAASVQPGRFLRLKACSKVQPLARLAQNSLALIYLCITQQRLSSRT